MYTKKRGENPDLGDPICLRQGASIETVCHAIHRTLASHFKYALVWGKSSKFNPQPQKVGLNHLVQDEDVYDPPFLMSLSNLQRSVSASLQSKASAGNPPL